MRTPNFEAGKDSEEYCGKQLNKTLILLECGNAQDGGTRSSETPPDEIDNNCRTNWELPYKLSLCCSRKHE